MVQGLVNTLFTQENCKNCKKGIWIMTDCNYDDETISHTAKVLNEKHEHYVCSAKCDTPGYMTKIYRL